jgi:ABC-2 type transport system ATP-binding protein
MTELRDDLLIDLRGITKDYGRLRALDAVDLRIRPGITGLLGPNGAGKSTLIKAIIGLVRLTSGSGTVLGFEIGRDAREIRARLGYMPEDDCYIGGIAGVEMARFMARLSGLPSLEALRRSHEILDFCGIEEERYRAVETYSTGMRQKLKFAQAIVHDPPLLILDEPTSGLDPEERAALLRRVRLLSRRAGKAVLISTHILPDVQEICDHVVILARGRVRITESLEVLSRPTTPAYCVRVVSGAPALLERLRAAGLEATLEENGQLTVADGGEGFVENLWRWAREANAPIRRLTPARNSLEQIFLEAIAGVSHADS